MRINRKTLLGEKKSNRLVFGSVIAPIFILLLVDYANALPLQYLPEIPGYIPVYIRHGDEPLEDINPDLAEAFHESNYILKDDEEISVNKPPSHIQKVLTDKKSTTIRSKQENTVQNNAKPSVFTKPHIYILPQDGNVHPEKSKTSDKEPVFIQIPTYPMSDYIEVKVIQEKR